MPARKALNMDTFEGKLAARLLELRENAGLTQAQAAEKIGIATGLLYAWENGRKQPPLRRLPIVAEVYGVSIGDILKKFEDF